jgi:hypothetical protein
MKARFEELAPWHVNGTLAANDREWVEGYVRDHPEAAAELAWYQSLQGRMRENVPSVGEEYGWDRLHARIRSERRAASPGWGERLAALLRSVLVVPRPALAYAAMALVVVQAGVIGVLMVEKDKEETAFSDYRTYIAAGQSPGEALRVSFKPDAPERQIRMILIGVGGTLIGGPSQLGDYYVYVAQDRIESTRKSLAANSAVDSVDVITVVPRQD